jgi:hypothetical protein
MISNYSLTSWQKKQAALLYYFSSLEYLKDVKNLVDDLLSAQNWGNGGWPFLANFELSLAKNITARAAEAFNITGRNQCARGIAEYSMKWTSPTEQAHFDQLFSRICELAFNIDLTMNKTGSASKWDDYGLSMAWLEHAYAFSKIPKFQVRKDVVAVTGTVPARTGVYVSLDDPNAALQFAWTGGGGGRLMDNRTLNGLGQAALSKVGRNHLWIDKSAMLGFVKENRDHAGLRSDPFFDDSQTEDLAPSLVARQAFMTRPCRWYYVEIIHDEFELLGEDRDDSAEKKVPLRFEAGTACPTPAFYLTPAKENSLRYFKTGEVFPEVASTYGATIWQYDEVQE